MKPIKFRQTIESNKGITDFTPESDRSETRKGFVYHSSFDFNYDTIGTFYKVINRFVKDKPRGILVELGCGSGIIAPFLPKTMTYVGLDANPDCGIFAKELNDERVNLITVDVTTEYNIEPRLEADFLVSFDFFEHMEPEKIDFVLNRIEPLLAVGGRAFLIIDTIELKEHLIRESRQWWLDKFAINAPSWKCYEEPDFINFYLQNVPPHWKWNVPQQHAITFVRQNV